MAGQLAALMLPDGSFLPYTKDNQRRVLATSGEDRSPFDPDVATFAEQGVKEIVVTEWFGLFAPAATPPAVLRRAAEAIAKAVASKEIAQAFANFGMVPKSDTPAELAALIKSERRPGSDDPLHGLQAAGVEKNVRHKKKDKERVMA